jgi:N utilization substance protein B
LIETYAEHWKIRRMGVVDRNVLRIALYELHYCKDIPKAVVLNEAIDLAKYFSNSDSGKFVNGILDRACKNV